MSHSKTRLARTVDRRAFLRTGVAAAVGTAAARCGVVAAGESSTDPNPIATRKFGKTGRELPILGYGVRHSPRSGAIRFRPKIV